MSTTSKNRHKPNLVMYILSLPFRFVGLILLGWFVALLSYAVFTAWQGHQYGYYHCEQMLKKEVSILFDNSFKTDLIQSSLQQEVILIQYLQKFSKEIQVNDTINYEAKNTSLKGLVNLCYSVADDYVRIIIAVTQLVLLRLTNILCFVPLIALIGAVSFISGFVQRYLRRINGGRESALIYHYAKASIKSILLLGCTIYLALPVSIDPIEILVPCMVCSGVAIYLATKMFKKYG